MLEIPPLPPNTILLVEVSSTAHGTGIPGGEDHDEMGVVVGISVQGVLGTTVLEACRGERIATYRRIRLRPSDGRAAPGSRSSRPSTNRISPSCWPT